MEKLFLSDVNKNLVERSISEIRRSRPILIYNKYYYSLITATELLSENLLNKYLFYFQNSFIVITKNRLNYLLNSKSYNDSVNYRIIINRSHDIKYISLLLDNKSLRNFSIDNIDIYKSSYLDFWSIKIMKMAKLLPSVIITDLIFKDHFEMEEWCKKHDILTLHKDLIDKYHEKYELDEICGSPLFLKECTDAQIIIYRSNCDALEYYAIKIGQPDNENPLVRIHSSCYTGDLLDSLSCDCRNQLHMSIKFMVANHGGIILYIPQDGRGIGLVNKIRTYQKQIHNNFDTVDANRFFGFEDDERIFTPAVEILKKLGISKIKLLTNNPNKVKEIEKYGLLVTQSIPIVTECNQYNENYLKTKAERFGHALENVI